MTNEQREAIEYLERQIRVCNENAEICDDNNFDEEATHLREESYMLDTVLSLIKEQQEEIEKRDNAVRKIINRLDNDYKRITETKRDKNKFPNYLDDYTKCRLKAYRTKTREIKEYIEQQYFERKAEDVE